MGNLGPLVVLACACVTFGDTEVWSVKVPRSNALRRYVSPEGQKGYRHKEWMQRLASEGALYNAHQSAITLALESGAASQVSDHASPAAPASGNVAGPARWLMDTGSGYDLVARNEVPAVLMGFARHADEPLELHTANGATLADKVVDLQVGPLLEVVSPLLLDSTPAVA